MDPKLKESFQACEQIARKRARNFYYAFTVLPKAKRRAICSMYAFMRYCDDISDSDDPPSSKVDALRRWRSDLDSALDGDYGRSRILPAFHDTVRRFDIPEVYFHRLIDGAEMDLSINRYQTFDELYQYCYKVASLVGLVCIHIFGFTGDVAKDYAESCGIAFQLTNILRDIREDGERNRIYIPIEDLTTFGYSEEDLLTGIVDGRFNRLMEFQVSRARDYYGKAMPLLNHVDSASRPCLAAMIGIYSTLLDRIEARGYDVFAQRIALSSKEKLTIAAQSALRSYTNGRELALADVRK